MTDEDPVEGAVDELYGLDPAEFTPRRTALAAQARAAGNAPAAKAITALRKPTKAAFVVNRLFRSDARVADQLLELGEELRQAQRAADVHRIRKLDGARKELIEELTGLAFDAADESAPSAALREEVSASLKAGLADEQVAEMLRSGTLLKSIEWDGFGFPSAPELSVVVPRAARTVPERAADSEPDKDSGAVSDRGKTTAAQRQAAADERKAAAEERRAAAAAKAEAAARAAKEKQAEADKELKKAAKAKAAAVATADKVVAAATKAEQELQKKVRRLHDELDTARQDLEQAKETLRRATIAQRRASQALRLVPDADTGSSGRKR